MIVRIRIIRIEQMMLVHYHFKLARNDIGRVYYPYPVAIVLLYFLYEERIVRTTQNKGFYVLQPMVAQVIVYNRVGDGMVFKALFYRRDEERSCQFIYFNEFIVFSNGFLIKPRTYRSFRSDYTYIIMNFISDFLSYGVDDINDGYCSTDQMLYFL